MSFFDLFRETDEPEKEKPKTARREGQVTDTEFAEEAHLDLHQEELDIHKQRVETGDVVLHKDVVEEEKTVDVPVSHDQVIIERKAVDREPTDEPIKEETVHIPVTAEKVDVDKHTVVTGEVSAHKRAVQETEQVHDVLHKEVAEVEEQGETEIINED